MALAAAPSQALGAGTWVEVGGSLNVNASADAISRAIATDGTNVYVAFTQDEGGIRVGYVKRWDGSAWQQMGTAINLSTTVTIKSVDLAADAGEVAVSWVEDKKGYVRRWDGSAWTLLGTSTNVDPMNEVWSVSLALAGPTPYVAQREAVGSTSSAWVRTWDGTSWTTVGGAEVAVGISWYPTIALDGGVPYVAYNASGTWLQQWNGSSWVQVGSGSMTGGGPSDIEFASGVPYVALHNSGGSVQTLSAGNWVAVGDDVTQCSDYEPEMTLDGTTPIVAIEQDYCGYDRGAVRRFDGTAWGNLPLWSSHMLGGITMVSGEPWLVTDRAEGGFRQVRVLRWTTSTGLAHATLVPDGDRTSPTGFVQWDMASGCVGSTANLFATVDETAQTPLDTACGTSDADYMSTPTATGTSTMSFHLSDAPANAVDITGVRLKARTRKDGGRAVDFALTLRRTDGTAIASLSAASSTSRKLDMSVAEPLSVPKVDMDGAYLDADMTVSGGGSATYGMLSTADVEIRYTTSGGSAPGAPTHVSPADATATADTTPTLTATYNDADAGDTGTIEFEMCTVAVAAASDCAASGGTVVAQGSSASGVAAGADGSFTPAAAIAPGTYHWHARATDSATSTGPWSATWQLTITTPPDTPTHVSPGDSSTTTDATPTMTAAYSDADGDTGSLTFEVCTVAVAAGSDCAAAGGTVVASGSSATALASGTNGSYTPSTDLADGTYHWHARAADIHGVGGSWSSSWQLVIDAPAITISVDLATISLGMALPGDDVTASATVTVATDNVTGYQLTAVDESDTWAMDQAGTYTIDDWTGTATTPTVWPAGTQGHAGISVRDATGGRLAKWGAGTGTSEGDFVNNYYAGLDNAATSVLHTATTSTVGDTIVTTYRANAAGSQQPGTYDATIALTATVQP